MIHACFNLSPVQLSVTVVTPRTQTDQLNMCVFTPVQWQCNETQTAAYSNQWPSVSGPWVRRRGTRALMWWTQEPFLPPPTPILYQYIIKGQGWGMVLWRQRRTVNTADGRPKLFVNSEHLALPLLLAMLLQEGVEFSVLRSWSRHLETAWLQFCLESQ